MKSSSPKNQALLLCGGLGTRLRPLTNSIPKCLVPINGVPLLEIWLEMLTRNGFDKIVVNTHHHKDLVIDFVRRSPWRDLVMLTEETELLGTAGTLKENVHRFDLSKPILLAHGDNLTTFNAQEFLYVHAARPPTAAMTMLSFITDTPQTCGILDCDNLGLVQGFYEKQPNPPGNVANAAVYLLSKEVVEAVVGLDGRILDFSTQVIPGFVGRILAHLNKGYHRDIGTLDSWRLAQHEYPHEAMPPQRHQRFADYFTAGPPTRELDEVYKNQLDR